MGSARGGFLEPLASFLFGAHFSFSKEKCVKKKRFSKPSGTGKPVPYGVGAKCLKKKTRTVPCGMGFAARRALHRTKKGVDLSTPFL